MEDYEVWPLRDEILAIAKTHKDNCIIVVDDIKVPGRNILYDKFGPHECSLAYIKSQLQKAFTKFEYYYAIPRNSKHRAKLVVLPKKWKV